MQRVWICGENKLKVEIRPIRPERKPITFRLDESYLQVILLTLSKMKPMEVEVKPTGRSPITFEVDESYLEKLLTVLLKYKEKKK